MALRSGIDSAISKTNKNVLLPENLTLHEVVFTIRHVGGIIRKIKPNKYTECLNEIRFLLTAILLECEYLQPKQNLCAQMQIITPCLWYWAIANNKNTFTIQKFHDIYSNEGWLLKTFLDNTPPFVIPSCPSFNALLQALEKYYTTVKPHFFSTDKQLHYKIPDKVLQWRNSTNKDSIDSLQENHEDQIKKWLRDNETKLVEVPELPSNWIGNDPFTRPVLFNGAIQKSLQKIKDSDLDHDYIYKRPLPVNNHDAHNAKEGLDYSPYGNPSNISTSMRSSSENDYYNRSPSIKSIHEEVDVTKVSVTEVTYEPSAVLKWRDTIQDKITNVMIARNKITNKLEIIEQELNPLLHCVSEIIFTEKGVFINQ